MQLHILKVKRKIKIVSGDNYNLKQIYNQNFPLDFISPLCKQDNRTEWTTTTWEKIYPLMLKKEPKESLESNDVNLNFKCFKVTCNQIFLLIYNCFSHCNMVHERLAGDYDVEKLTVRCPGIIRETWLSLRCFSSFPDNHMRTDSSWKKW